VKRAVERSSSRMGGEEKERRRENDITKEHKL
jgi:hypothetical protein